MHPWWVEQRSSDRAGDPRSEFAQDREFARAHRLVAGFRRRETGGVERNLRGEIGEEIAIHEMGVFEAADNHVFPPEDLFPGINEHAIIHGANAARHERERETAGASTLD